MPIILESSTNYCCIFAKLSNISGTKLPILSKLKKALSFSLLQAWNVKLCKNSVNAFFEIVLPPPKCIFKTASPWMNTKALASVALYFW